MNLDANVNPDPEIKVSEFIQNFQWNTQKLNQILNNYQVIQKIIGIPIPLTEIRDSFC